MVPSPRKGPYDFAAVTRASAFFVIDAQVPEVGRSPVSGEPVVPVAPDRPVIAIPHGIGPSPSAAPTMAPNLVLGTSVAILRARGAPLFSARAPPFPPPPPPHVNVQEYYFAILCQLEQLLAAAQIGKEPLPDRVFTHILLLQVRGASQQGELLQATPRTGETSDRLLRVCSSMRGFAAAKGRCQGSGVYLLFALWNMTTVYFFEALLLGIFGLCPGWLLPGVRWLRRALLLRRPKRLKDAEDLVAEWIHFTLFGIIVPTIKLKVQTFGGDYELSN